MDAALHDNIMNALMITAYFLILAAVWTACQLVKQKAVFVYELQLLLWRLKK